MKIRKILAAVSAALIMGTTATTCFALGDGEATYCFDTADRVSDWETFGSVENVNFKLKQITAQSKNGEGSLAITEDVTGDVSDQYGGAFITADKVGLEDFRGCRISMSVLLSSNAENHCENFVLYSDGMIWLQAVSEEGLSSKAWTDIVLEIPEDASNPRVGFTIPTFDLYTGDVLYIDDFSITDAEGNLISNLGDYKMKTVSSADTVPSWVNIVLIAVLVLLVGAIVVGIIVLVSKNTKKFH